MLLTLCCNVPSGGGMDALDPVSVQRPEVLGANDASSDDSCGH